MKTLFFWNQWTKPYRTLYLIALSLFVGSALFFVFSEYMGKNLGLKWEVAPEIKTTRILVDSFQKGFFQFGVEAENQYIFQSFTGSAKNTLPWFPYLVVGGMFILLVAGSVTISYVKSWWYYIALTALGLFFYFLNLDVLEVFGLANMYWTVIAFLVFGIGIHVFHAFSPLTPIAHRYAFFASLAILFFYLTLSFSRLGEPIYYLASYGWYAPFGLALVYILIISTDLFSGFLYLVTDSKNANKSSSLLNFLLISLFYLGNLVLTFLKNRASIDWNILYVEAPLILLFTSVLGIWAHKKKEPIYQFMADFSPATAVWLLVLAINCFLCYGYANLSGNDPLQEVLEDAVIFSQITFGFMFLIFVIANFMSMMEQNLPAHMVAYKPRFMPFGFVRIIGVIGIFAIVMYNNQYQYRQLKTGYYIGIAEAYLRQDDVLLGEEYLKSALSFDEGNHKANYILGMLAHDKSPDDPIAKGLLKQSMFKKPTPQSYAALGYFFLQDGDIIRSLETLKEGVAKFPKSPEILNNLALAFAKTNIQDSTLYYFAQAKKRSEGNYVAASNEIAFALQRNTEPTLETDNIPNDLVYQTNLLALQNKAGKPLSTPPSPTFLNDTALTIYQTAFLVNLAFNNLKDTTQFKTHWLDSLMKKPANVHYVEPLMQAKAFRQYYGGQVTQGIVTLDQLQATGTNVVQNTNTLSNWLIQQDAPRVAMDFLSKARNAGDMKTAFGMAIATSFYLSGKEALDYWHDPILLSDSTFKKIAYALSTKQPNVFSVGILPQLFDKPEALYKLFYTLPNGNEKNKALGRLMQYLNDVGRADLSIQLYQENAKTDESEWQYLRALRKTNQRKLAQEASKKVLENTSTLYIQAWASNDPKQAQQLYKEALAAHPLYEDGVVDAIAFLQSKQKDDETYDIILQSVMLNQYSIPIQQAYAKQCVRMNLFGYTDFTLGKLKDLMPIGEYKAFEASIRKAQEERVNSMEWK